MAEIASLLHISDLHFYENLTFTGGRHWGRRALGVKGHSHAKIYSFAQTILKDRLAEGLEDLLIATGDISTDGAEKSLEIAKDYFELPAVYENGRLSTWGLAAGNDRRLVVPGNHDRYGDFFLPYESATNRTLEEVFALEDEYPYVRGYRRADKDISAPTLLFFVFDSTLTRGPAESPNPFRRIARGLLTPQDCDWLESITNLLREQGSVRSIQGESLPFEYGNTIRIALLHHHPVRKEKTGLFQFLDKRSWSVMEGADRFLDACFTAEIDLVLFGHEHENYNEVEQRANAGRTHTIRFVCCPSTTEYSENSGYYRIDFDHAEYRMTLFQWMGTAYRKVRTYDQPYNRPPVGIAKSLTAGIAPPTKND